MAAAKGTGSHLTTASRWTVWLITLVAMLLGAVKSLLGQKLYYYCCCCSNKLNDLELHQFRESNQSRSHKITAAVTRSARLVTINRQLSWAVIKAVTPIVRTMLSTTQAEAKPPALASLSSRHLGPAFTTLASTVFPTRPDTMIIKGGFLFSHQVSDLQRRHILSVWGGYRGPWVLGFSKYLASLCIGISNLYRNSGEFPTKE